MAGDGQTSRRWREKIRPQFREQCETENAPCWLCSMPIDYTITDKDDDEVWEPDHLYPRSTHPEHAEDPANLRASHRRCNNKRGNRKPQQGLGTLTRQWLK